MSKWLVLVVVFFCAGWYGRGELWFSYLHEYGHVWAAEQEGIPAHIQNDRLTTIQGAMTKTILVSGMWMELLVWGGLAIVFSLPRWGGVPLGFCLGFATRVYDAAPGSTDFIRAGAEGLTQWNTYALLTLAVVYLIVGLRARKWWKHDISSSTNGAHDEHPLSL